MDVAKPFPYRLTKAFSVLLPANINAPNSNSTFQHVVLAARQKTVRVKPMVLLERDLKL